MSDKHYDILKAAVLYVQSLNSTESRKHERLQELKAAVELMAQPCPPGTFRFGK